MQMKKSTAFADSVHPALPWVGAVLSGVLAFLGYAGFNLYYLEWICLVPVLFAIIRAAPGRAFLLGWVSGIVGHAGGFYWIATLLRQFADAPWLLAVGGLLLLSAANGLVFALWAWAVRWISRDLGWSVFWLAPVVWTAAEKFVPQLFPNFLGASQYKLILLTQVSDLTGILGVSFLLVFINAAFFSVIENLRTKQQRPWKPAIVLGAIIGAVLVYGAVRINMVDETAAKAESVSVGLVQTNRGAGDKHVNAEQFLREHVELSKELLKNREMDLVVWPESVLAVHLPVREGKMRTDIFGDTATPLLFGALIQTDEYGERRLYNSAILLDKTGNIAGTYDKVVLVPFGEYIPFGDIFPQLYAWSPYSGRLWAGKSREPLMLDGHPLSINICYEDIFPGHVRVLMQGGRNGRIPEAIFNLTNDSWYGDTVQPTEHLVLASFRAIEHRRTLVRSTNTGISAIVDPVGRIEKRTGQWTKETLSGRVSLLQGRTVYAVLGDWIGWVCAAITFIGIIRARPKAKKQHSVFQKNTVNEENVDPCRCKEVSSLSPKGLLSLLYNDLAFWKKSGKSSRQHAGSRKEK